MALVDAIGWSLLGACGIGLAVLLVAIRRALRQPPPRRVAHMESKRSRT